MEKGTARRQPFQEKLRYSIVFRLNFRLFFRLLGILIGLDILLCILFCSGYLIRVEYAAASYIGWTDVNSLPDGAQAALIQKAGYHLGRVDRAPQGIPAPSFLRNLLPAQTRDAGRSFTFGPAGGGWQGRLRQSVYTVEVARDGGCLSVAVLPGDAAAAALPLAYVLLAVELLTLLTQLGRNARTIRRAIRPVYELAEAAEALNSRSGLSPTELQRLAGTLNAINAAHLDTRISMGGTQNELKTLAAAINGMLDRINEAYRSQIRFVSDASHELRTPIAVIQGYANLLDRWGKNDPETMQESITAIKNEAEAMKNLVEQLLFLARSDNNTLRVSITEFDAAEVAEEVCREARMIDPAHTFESRLPSPVPIRGDIGLIKQAVRILVDNSIQYTPTGGRILLSARLEGDRAVLSVQDEGIGMPEEAVPHIFDRFYRTDESRARRTGGTGLGLSIAKRIVDEHGGSFDVLSRQGLGTRITILLPAAGPG